MTSCIIFDNAVDDYRLSIVTALPDPSGFSENRIFFRAQRPLTLVRGACGVEVEGAGASAECGAIVINNGAAATEQTYACATELRRIADALCP
ncbi:hypothetical protein NOR51B_616 [Luminiphilus syltensis NOR5-1B]|uniref:Uncharacterized protein n=1 Tax=Luminiphilus syltensis NOR5-1B TaxID=565045 RepID=B8KSJ0_9GAMM|nr:hypothetical protein NOR51B_616 [Luminiphilus syltensis NOR5-1B]